MLDGKEKRIARIVENMQRRSVETIDQTITLDITDDMYCGALPQDAVHDFVCMLCFGITIDPVKCYTCSSLICKNCLGVDNN